jgi:hypothetical protein
MRDTPTAIFQPKERLSCWTLMKRLGCVIRHGCFSGLRNTTRDNAQSKRHSKDSTDCHKSAASGQKWSKDFAPSTRIGSELPGTAANSDTRHGELGEVHDEIELALIETERNEIDQLFRKGMLNGEARRRIERELDLREARFLNYRSEDVKHSNVRRV